MSRPPFVALEGIDGTGKSTQCRLLADWLRGRGYTVTQCADPGGTPLGDELRSMVARRAVGDVPHGGSPSLHGQSRRIGKPGHPPGAGAW